MTTLIPEALEAAARAIYLLRFPETFTSGDPWPRLSIEQKIPFFEQAQAAILAYQENAWRPMSEAPKDGTYILAAGGTVHYHDDSMSPYEGPAVGPWILLWSERYNLWLGDTLEGIDNFIEHRPAVWQPAPLPTPPEGK